MTDAVVPFTGWGRGTWGELAFGEGSITNAGASGQVGSVTIVAEANVLVTGVFGTGQIGAVTVEADANAPVTGLEMTGAVGGVTVIADANVDVTGVSATGFVGSVAVNAAANVTVTGVAGTGQVGPVTVEADANVPVTGLEATGAVGTVGLRGRKRSGRQLAGRECGRHRYAVRRRKCPRHGLWHDQRGRPSSCVGKNCPKSKSGLHSGTTHAIPRMERRDGVSEPRVDPHRSIRI
jgi:hypothetical protein